MSRNARTPYVGNMVDLKRATITLDYRVNYEAVRYAVRLVSTVPRFGGRPAGEERTAGSFAASQSSTFGPAGDRKTGGYGRTCR